MLPTIIPSLPIDGIGLSSESQSLVAALLAAAQITFTDVRSENGISQRVPADGDAIDDAFRAIEVLILALPESTDRALAISRMGDLWSSCFNRNVRLFKVFTIEMVSRQLILAQLAACYAAGDAENI